jgi:hypothetical protein
MTCLYIYDLFAWLCSYDFDTVSVMVFICFQYEFWCGSGTVISVFDFRIQYVLNTHQEHIRTISKPYPKFITPNSMHIKIISQNHLKTRFNSKTRFLDLDSRMYRWISCDGKNTGFQTNISVPFIPIRCVCLVTSRTSTSEPFPPLSHNQIGNATRRNVYVQSRLRWRRMDTDNFTWGFTKIGVPEIIQNYTVLVLEPMPLGLWGTVPPF